MVLGQLGIHLEKDKVGFILHTVHQDKLPINLSFTLKNKLLEENIPLGYKGFLNLKSRIHLKNFLHCLLETLPHASVFHSAKKISFLSAL